MKKFVVCAMMAVAFAFTANAQEPAKTTEKKSCYKTEQTCNKDKKDKKSCDKDSKKSCCKSGKTAKKAKK